VRSAPSHGQSSGERCVGWAASPWSSKTGVYEDRLEEGETAAAMPSRQVVAAIAPAKPTLLPLPRCLRASRHHGARVWSRQLASLSIAPATLSIAPCDPKHRTVRTYASRPACEP